MSISTTKTPAAATSEQPAAAPLDQPKGGFIPGAVAAQGCCGSSGAGSGCCGETAAETSAPAVQKPAVAPIALQSGCCGSSSTNCCG